MRRRLHLKGDVRLQHRSGYDIKTDTDIKLRIFKDVQFHPLFKVTLAPYEHKKLYV